MVEFCECGSLIQDEECSNRRCPLKDKKLTSWIIEGTYVKFREPVTLSEAIQMSKTMVPAIKKAANSKVSGEDVWAITDNRFDRIKKKRS